MVLIAAARGIPVPTLLAAVGFSQEQLADSEATLPLSLHLSLWRQAALMSGDDSFGLHMGESVPRGTFGLKEYIIRNSPNLGAGLRALIRYQGLLIPNILRVVEEEAAVRVEHAAPGTVDPAIRHAAEHEVAVYQIRQQQLPIGEVAFLLGYSEVSAFYRAFRRWTGMSTAQFRKQH